MKLKSYSIHSNTEPSNHVHFFGQIDCKFKNFVNVSFLRNNLILVLEFNFIPREIYFFTCYNMLSMALTEINPFFLLSSLTTLINITKPKQVIYIGLKTKPTSFMVEQQCPPSNPDMVSS